MKTFVFDFETYYNSNIGYTLRKMTPVEYILDHRFETIGCAVERNSFCTFMSPSQFNALLVHLRRQQEAGEEIAVISHNALFDMCVLAWRHDFIPDLMIDTLGMARAMVQSLCKSLSLDSLVSKFELGEKGKFIAKMDGMTLQMLIDQGLWDDVCLYATTDATLAGKLFRFLMKRGFPKEELITADMVLRCAVDCEVGFVIDQPMLYTHLHNVQQDKASLLQRCNLSSETLMSNEKFAEALRGLGVDPPMKISASTGKETYAFAKTDGDFLDLEEHDDPDVQALVAARLGVKSTIEETRTQRFINISQLCWPDSQPARMPVALKFSGAHTHRLSGDWKLNLQNLGAGRSEGKVAALRQSLRAPKGYKVVVADASQIEARLNATFSGQTDLVQSFAQGNDVYSDFASFVFNKPVSKKTDPTARFVGKTSILGLGYNMGWPKFQATIKVKSKTEIKQELVLTDTDAGMIVNGYRTRYAKIAGIWKYLQGVIPQMTRRDCHIEFSPVTFVYERIILPNGLSLFYEDLRNEGGQWTFTYGGKRKYIYGGKMLENIIQALSRICTMDAAVRMRKKYGYKLKLQEHDALAYIVPEEAAEECLDLLIDEMKVRPAWMPDIPLAAEGGIGDSFGDAK